MILERAKALFVGANLGGDLIDLHAKDVDRADDLRVMTLDVRAQVGEGGDCATRKTMELNKIEVCSRSMMIEELRSVLYSHTDQSIHSLPSKSIAAVGLFGGCLMLLNLSSLRRLG